MTGYGRSEAALGGRSVVIEIKSLNHRNLEVIVRLPAFLSFLESAPACHTHGAIHNQTNGTLCIS